MEEANVTKPDKTQPMNQDHATVRPVSTSEVEKLKEEVKKKPVDRSPENNLREALKLCRQARAKMVTKGNEETGEKIKDAIELIAKILEPVKTEPTT
jgi:hypothetical protein